MLGSTIRKARFTEEQIVSLIKEAEAGVPVRDLCRKHGVAEMTFYRWRRKYIGLEVGDFIESFNSRCRDEWLDQQIFLSLSERGVRGGAKVLATRRMPSFICGTLKFRSNPT